MNSNKISLMFLKNEGNVRRFKLSPFIMGCLLLIIFILPFVAGISIWLNFQYYFEKEKYDETLLEYKYQLEQFGIIITRLSNLENYLEKHSPHFLEMLESQGISSDFIEFNLEKYNELEDNIPQKQINLAETIISISDKEKELEIKISEVKNINSEIENNIIIAENTEKNENRTINGENSDLSEIILENQENDQENSQVNDQKIEEIKEVNQDILGEDTKITDGLVSEETSEISKITDNDDQEEVIEKDSEGLKNEEIVDSDKILVANEDNKDAFNINLGYVEIERPRAVIRNKSIRFMFIVRSLGKEDSISGNQKYYLVNIESETDLSEVQKIPLPSATNDSFKIKNLKEVNSNISLSEQKLNKNSKLLMEIISDDKIIFSRIYEIDNLQNNI